MFSILDIPVLLKVFSAVRLQLQLGSDGVGESHRKERSLIAILASSNNVLVVGQRRSSKVFRIFLLASASSLPRRRARVFEVLPKVPVDADISETADLVFRNPMTPDIQNQFVV